MLLLLLALAGASLIAPFLIRALGPRAFGIIALAPLAGFIWVLTHYARGTFAGGGALHANYGWLSSAHLDITLRMDSLAALFSLIILGIGTLVLIYCWGYFDAAPRRLRYFSAQLTGFAAAMYGLVISDNLLLLYVFWEITSILSFLLVGYYGERASSRLSAERALMVTTLGGLAMLVGIIVLGRQTDVWTLSGLADYGLEGTHHITYAIVLILAGALSKSAIAPAHFWLPGAMAAPTPVSAYLHSAAMVKAGIYLVARMSPDFNFTPVWHLVILTLGTITMVMAGWMSLRQKDLKLVLAYGTVSQLGFIVCVVGIGSREALMAGLALTFAHSMFKAALFMVVGAIDHTTGTRDCRELSGLGRRSPLLFGVAVVAAASMAGIPPLFGFIAKEAVFEEVLHEPLLTGMPGKMLLTGMIVGSVMTMAYSLHFLHGAFATKPETHSSGGGTSPAVANMHAMRAPLWVPALLLALSSLVFGLYPAGLDFVIGTHLDSVFPGEKATHLALWHGFGAPLVISGFIIVAGLVIFWQRAVVAKAYFQEPALGNASAAYDAVISFLRHLSLKLTASTQRGSLMLNLATIFVVLVITPTTLLFLGARTDVRMQLWNNPLEGVTAGIIVVTAIAAAITHNRLSGLLMVGATGFAVSFIFATYGAPDLALTQLLVETITVVVFMLVLRKMPPDTVWRAGPKATRARAWLSIAVGVAVVVFMVFAQNARTTQPVSVWMSDLAYEISHGANTVNVLLVDIRAWDTLGEISVLVIAAIGIASLIYRNRSFDRGSRRPTLRVAGRRWLAVASSAEKQRNRSLLVDVSTRVLFPSMIVISFYFFFAGHNAPGGGFAGGLVASLAITLRYLAGGREELEEAFPVDASRVLGTGLLLSVATALAPVLMGLPVLTSLYYPLMVPVIGKVSLSSVLLFDAGVYLIVLGLTIRILDTLGGQLDQDEQMRKQRARDRARRLRKNAERLKAENAARMEAARGASLSTPATAQATSTKETQERHVHNEQQGGRTR